MKLLECKLIGISNKHGHKTYEITFNPNFVVSMEKVKKQNLDADAALIISFVNGKQFEYLSNSFENIEKIYEKFNKAIMGHKVNLEEFGSITILTCKKSFYAALENYDSPNYNAPFWRPLRGMHSDRLSVLADHIHHENNVNP